MGEVKITTSSDDIEVNVSEKKNKTSWELFRNLILLAFSLISLIYGSVSFIKQRPHVVTAPIKFEFTKSTEIETFIASLQQIEDDFYDITDSYIIDMITELSEESNISEDGASDFVEDLVGTYQEEFDELLVFNITDSSEISYFEQEILIIEPDSSTVTLRLSDLYKLNTIYEYHDSLNALSFSQQETIKEGLFDYKENYDSYSELIQSLQSVSQNFSRRPADIYDVQLLLSVENKSWNQNYIRSKGYIYYGEDIDSTRLVRKFTNRENLDSLEIDLFSDSDGISPAKIDPLSISYIQFQAGFKNTPHKDLRAFKSFVENDSTKLTDNILVGIQDIHDKVWFYSGRLSVKNGTVTNVFDKKLANEFEERITKRKMNSFRYRMKLDIFK